MALAGEKRWVGYSGWMRKLVLVLALGVWVFAAVYWFQPVYIASTLFLPIFAGVLMFLAFLRFTHRSQHRWERWYGIVASILSLVVCFYAASLYKEAQSIFRQLYPFEIVLGFLAFLLAVDLSRRAVGWPIAILAILFGAYALFGYYLPGAFHIPKLPPSYFVRLTYLGTEGLFGALLNIMATILVAMMLIGQLFLNGTAGERLQDLAGSLVGRFAGGPAKVSVISSALYGTVSGGAVSNIIVTGSFTIPMMKKMGFQPHLAAAVECAASNGGAIMPPVMASISFIMADFLAVPYGKIVVAAFIPAFIYYLCLFMQVHFEAKKAGLEGTPREMLPTFWKSLGGAYSVIILIIALLVFLVPFMWHVAKAGYYAIAIFILVSAFSKSLRMGPKIIIRSIEGVIWTLLALIGPFLVAGLIMSTLSSTGVAPLIMSALVGLTGGSTLGILILSAAIAFVMGMGVNALLSYILLAALVGPVLVQTGIPPMLAHLFFLWWSLTAPVTPPIAMAVFVAAPMANSKFWPTAWKAVSLSLPIYVLPFAWVYNQAIVAGFGTWLDTAIEAIPATIGIVFMAAAVVGYLLRRLNWVERVLLALSGLLSLTPILLVTLVGLAIGIVIFTKQVVTCHRK